MAERWFVILEFDEVGAWPVDSGEIYTDLTEATAVADQMQAESLAARLPERFKVYELAEVKRRG